METGKIHVVRLGSESGNTETNPERAVLEIADFADSLAFGYGNVAIYFDLTAPPEEVNEFIRLFQKLFVRAVVREEPR